MKTPLVIFGTEDFAQLAPSRIAASLPRMWYMPLRLQATPQQIYAIYGRPVLPIYCSISEIMQNRCEHDEHHS